MPWPLKIRDDRGAVRRMPARAPGGVFGIPKRGTTQWSLRCWRARHWIKWWSEAWWVRLIAAGIAVVLMGKLVWEWRAIYGVERAGRITMLSLFAFFAVFWKAYFRAVSRRMSSLWREVHPACVVCEYDLRGLEVEGDGCVVCPECGAAWRFAAGPRAGDEAR